jgi:hypothetical protein
MRQQVKPQTEDDMTQESFHSETNNSVGTNAPESEAITLSDNEVFEAARQAVMLLKKTFATWVTIGKAVMRARDIADRRGGGKTFMRLIEQQGLGPIINKSTASNLLRMMERLPDVSAWHETLTAKQQIEWAAPTTILKRCPIFNPPKANNADKPPTKAEQDRMALAVALEEVEQLKRRGDGSLFDLKRDNAADIGRVLADTISERKFKEIVKAAMRHYKKQRLEAKAAQPTGYPRTPLC